MKYPYHLILKRMLMCKILLLKRRLRLIPACLSALVAMLTKWAGGRTSLLSPPSHMASITYLEVPFGRNGFIGCRIDMYLE